MVDAIRETDLLDELSRSLAEIVGRSDQSRDEDVFENRALRQQAMILKDETDLGVAEFRGKRAAVETRPSLPEGGSSPPSM